MSGIGTGYDWSCTTFSPDGRVFQVEYAAKAVENSGTAVGLVCKDGVVLVVEKLILSKMLEEGSNNRIFTADTHVGIAVAGLSADCRKYAKKVSGECRSYERQYGDKIPAKVLGARAGNHAQFYTQFSHLRPYGCSTLIAVKDHGKPQLLMVEPSGLWYGYHAASIGKGRQSAQTELEKLDLATLSCRDALKEAAKIIYEVHDEVKDKDFELEMSWLCEETNWEHRKVPKDLAAAAEKQAQDELDEEDSDSESSDED